ncbi:hypothetical protein DFJ75_0973 [Williamsia muralis]|uniref:Uncharacterized protein n=1 Tax=Williamsia marianensis TaxID=85044 RepID=A0A495K115_WILMA|nr:hypothetical protein DFJ75_0973 [Williamsia muralis]
MGSLEDVDFGALLQILLGLLAGGEDGGTAT